jgi:anti-sigma factor RsiW
VDGLLPTPEAERVRAHLESCESCAADVLAAQAATSSMATWGDLEPPADAFDSILARISALPPEDLLPRGLDAVPEPAGAVFRPRIARWTTNIAVGAAAAVLIGVTVWSGSPSDAGRTRARPNSRGIATLERSTSLFVPAAFDARGAGADVDYGPRTLYRTGVEEVLEDAVESDGLRRTPRLLPPRKARTIPAGWVDVPAGRR